MTEIAFLNQITASALESSVSESSQLLSKDSALPLPRYAPCQPTFWRKRISQIKRQQTLVHYCVVNLP